MNKTQQPTQMPELGRGGLIAAVVAGVVASACCAGPLILVLLGVGGAWVSDLTLLDPIRPWLTGAALALLAYAHYRHWHRRHDPACDCATPPTSASLLWLWLGTVLVASAIALPYVLPYFILPH